VRIHQPFVLTLVAVVGVLVLTVVVSAETGLRRELESRHREELAREVRLAVRVLAAGGDRGPAELAEELHRFTGYRVTLIRGDGRVVAETDIPPARVPALPSHLDRPEVQGALAGEVSFRRGQSGTLGELLLYVSAPVEVEGMPGVLRLAAPVAPVESMVRGVQRGALGAGAVALVVALLLSYLLSLSLSRPLLTLAERARALASGDFTRRTPRGLRVRELDQLSAAFNRLAEELQARLSELGQERDEMQALIDCIAEGVLALTEDARVLRTNQAAAQLLQLPPGILFAPIGTVVRQPELRDLLEQAVIRPFQAREVSVGDRHLLVSGRLLDKGGAVVTFLDISEVRRVEQVRRDFVANASHELKTPLTAMRGFAETLLEGDPPPKLRQEFLESIRSNTLRLQHLVDDLLDLSRLESGGWVARPEQLRVAEVARGSWGEFAGRAEEQEVDFHVEGDSMVRADPQGLGQVFRNLFENALRYTPPGGEIAVRIQPIGPLALVQVADTGAGIPSSALPRIFERFYRVDPARSRAEGGTGLGLAIVRHLVSAMGGEVGAESVLGEGTTIHFTLPVANAPREPA